MSSVSFQPPGILADATEFNVIRERAAKPGILQDYAAFIVRIAESELAEPVATREMEGKRLLGVARAILRRVCNGAVAYQLTLDARFARRAIADLQAAAAFSDWNPSHFLDVGEFCTAFALGLDWLNDELTAEERLSLEDGLIRHGLEDPAADPKAWFITVTNNWNAVCNGGLAMGALAVRHRRPDLAEILIDRCIQNLPLHGENYAPDGAFIEGSTYWAYGTTFHVFTVEALMRCTGSTHRLDLLPGFRQSANYMTHMAGPSGGYFNYFDSRASRIPLPAMFWFGRHFDDASLTRSEAESLRTFLAGPIEAVRADESRYFALGILWLMPEHIADNEAAPLAWSGNGPNPVALWRSDLTPDAVWVGAKGGRATLSHGHIDAGSFVLEAAGVRWAVDPGMQNYHPLEAAGINIWGSDRWKVFRIGAEAHSIPRIDGEQPLPEGNCPRIAWTDTGFSSVTFDLTALYPNAVSKLTRTIASSADGLTRWTDVVSGLAAGRTYRFTWMTTADVAVNGSQVVLSENGKRFEINVDTPLPLTIGYIDAAELTQSFDEPNPGLKRVEFAVISAGTEFTVNVTGAIQRDSAGKVSS